MQRAIRLNAVIQKWDLITEKHRSYLTVVELSGFIKAAPYGAAFT